MPSTIVVDKIKSTSGDTFTLPTSDGSSGQVIQTDASGVLSFKTDAGIASLAADGSPQLGADLDCNGNDITSASNADVDINPHGTGDVVLKTDLVKIGGGSEAGVITSNGAYDLTLETNSGTNSGTIAITDGADGHIAVTPNGTGNVQLVADEVTIGDSGATATLTSNGTGNLLLNTNSGTNSSAIEITDAADGDIDFTCNGTGVINFNDRADYPQVSITSSSNATAWDAQAAPNAYHLTTENTTVGVPTNPATGAFISLNIKYGGSHTMAFNTVFEFAASTAPTFTSTINKVDHLTFRYNGACWHEMGRNLNMAIT